MGSSRWSLPAGLTGQGSGRLVPSIRQHGMTARRHDGTTARRHARPAARHRGQATTRAAEVETQPPAPAHPPHGRGSGRTRHEANRDGTKRAGLEAPVSESCATKSRAGATDQPGTPTPPNPTGVCSFVFPGGVSLDPRKGTRRWCTHPAAPHRTNSTHRSQRTETPTPTTQQQEEEGGHPPPAPSPKPAQTQGGIKTPDARVTPQVRAPLGCRPPDAPGVHPSVHSGVHSRVHAVDDRR
jgi:hypothetical protein